MRHVVVAVIFVFVLVGSVVGVAAQETPSGERVYEQYCAQCHEGSMPRMPSRAALRERSPEYIENTLSYRMRAEAAALSAAERRSVAAFLSGRPAGSVTAPLDALGEIAYCAGGQSRPTDPLGLPSWNGWGADLSNTRFQPADAAGLKAEDVPRLRLRWAFGFPGVTTSGSQATIVGGRVLVGSRNGPVYALDAETGCIDWVFEADAAVRSAPSVGRIGSGPGHAVYFGDAHAQVYAVDLETGSLRWKVKVEDHPDAMITGAPALHDGRLYVPVSSLEESTAGRSTYECCTFRGSVVALDAASGHQRWKRYTIAEAATRTERNSIGTQRWGPSGAGVWSAPTVDPDRNRLYVATGDSYSDPVAPESDAIMALAMDSGRILWVQQTLPGDAWNISCEETTVEGNANCPDSDGPDYDFGSSPVLTTLEDGRPLLLAGQKSGVLYGLNPDDGAVIWERRIADGGILGGIEWGFTTDGERTYAAISDAWEKDPGEAGGLAAVRTANGELVWQAPPVQDTCGGRAGCNTGQPGAVTSIPGVVFSGSLDGHIRAYDTETGRIIWDYDTVRGYDTVNRVPGRGGALNGPGVTIAGGMLYVSSGYSLMLDFMPGNVLLAFSVGGQ